MNQVTENDQVQFCPQCENHCPADALECGRGRKYFGAADSGSAHEHRGESEHGHGHGCGRRQLGGLPGLLHQCGRFVRHAELGEDELFQALTAEEQVTLQALLEKLSADWQARFGGESVGCCHGHHGHEGGKHHHQHEGRDQ